MKYIVSYILFMATFIAFCQEENKKATQTLQEAKQMVYEGNELALNADYVHAEMEYRKAISKEPSLSVGNYNLANAYYEKGSYDEALYRLQQAAKTAVSKEEKHKAFHNIGNVLMQNKKCKEATEAFKNALRNNPADEETRYNYALAKQCAEEQEEQQDQQDENQDQNDQDDNQEDKEENEDQNKEDQKDEGDQEQKEGDDQKDEKGDPKDEKEKDGKEENKEKEQPKPQPKPGQLSPQQIKNLLEAMNNQEEKVQEKINAEKTKGAKITTEKDW